MYKNEFIRQISDKENIRVDKFKYLSEEILDSEFIKERDIYIDNEDLSTEIYINAYLTIALDEICQPLVDKMVQTHDNLFILYNKIKFNEEEQKIVDSLFDNYVELLEDCEFLYTDYLKVCKVLNDYVLPYIVNK